MFSVDPKKKNFFFGASPRALLKNKMADINQLALGQLPEIITPGKQKGIRGIRSSIRAAATLVGISVGPVVGLKFRGINASDILIVIIITVAGGCVGFKLTDGTVVDSIKELSKKIVSRRGTGSVSAQPIVLVINPGKTDFNLTINPLMQQTTADPDSLV